MANGILVTGIEDRISPAGVSDDIDDYTSYVEHSLVDPGAALRGAGTSGVPDVIDQLVTGRRQRVWDREFFGIILVIPRTKDLGGVLTATSFQVEVWNADEISHRGTSVGVTGSDGVTVGPGPTLPTYWPPFSSYFTEIDIAAEGDPIIDSFVTWVFPGFTGTDCHVIGIRFTVYPLAHNWREAFSESHGYLSTVQPAKSGKEQRRSLRTVPIRTLDLSGLTSSLEESAYILAQLMNEGRLLFAVPYWPDAVRPTADVNVGATTIAVDTTTRIFEVGAPVLLWKDTATWEAGKIAALTSSSITLVSPTAAAWPRSTTIVLPLLTARLSEDAQPEQIRPGVHVIDAHFTTEPR